MQWHSSAEMRGILPHVVPEALHVSRSCAAVGYYQSHIVLFTCLSLILESDEVLRHMQKKKKEVNFPPRICIHECIFVLVSTGGQQV